MLSARGRGEHQQPGRGPKDTRFLDRGENISRHIEIDQDDVDHAIITQRHNVRDSLSEKDHMEPPIPRENRCNNFDKDRMIAKYSNPYLRHY